MTPSPAHTTNPSPNTTSRPIPRPTCGPPLEQSREDIIGFYRRAWAHADATIDSLDLTAEGSVPWWPEDQRTVTLHRILVHVATEKNRHAGHADIIRELIDGAAGLLDGNDNMPTSDSTWWQQYRAKLEKTAKQAAGLR